MVDSHIHTKEFSCDSMIKINEMVNEINKSNLKVIITEHMDLDYGDKDKFVFNTKEYFNKYDNYRGDNLFLGIELGLSKNFILENKKIIDENYFDYVLASAHFIGTFDVGSDPEFYMGKSKSYAYREYLIESCTLIDLLQDFDSFAHFDYVSRYSPYEDKEMYFEDFKEELSNLFTKIVNRGIVLELNTKRLTNEKTFNEYIKFFNLYKELGGRYVTTGSDAHYLKNIGFNFNLACDIIERIGLKPVYFKNRKITYI